MTEPQSPQPAQLPPLPKPESTVCIAHTERGITTTTWRTPGRDYFTADHMRAFARAASAAAPCGHPEALTLKSAETGEPLYCEACDDKSGRRDAEARESELMAANADLRAKLAAIPAPDPAPEAQRDGWNEPYNCIAAGPTATDVALWQAMNEAAKHGNRDDDKLIRKALNDAGYYLVRSMKKPGTCEHLLAAPCAAVKAESDEAEFEVWEGDELFAGTSGPRAQAWAELLRYAAQCEGVVRVFEVNRVERTLSDVPVQGRQP